MKFLWRWLITTAIVMAAAYLVPGVSISSIYTAFMTALILGLVNAIIRPIIVLFTFPLTLVTLGLFLLVINAFLLWLVSLVVPGFTLASLSSVLIMTIVISIFSWFTNMLLDVKL